MSEATSKLIRQTMMEGIARRKDDLIIHCDDTIAYQMVPENHLVDIYITHDDGSPLILLPPVTLCRGMFYSINLVAIDTDEFVLIWPFGSLTAQGPDDWHFNWFFTVMATEGDNIMLYSDGARWLTVGCGCDGTEPENGNGV